MNELVERVALLSADRRRLFERMLAQAQQGGGAIPPRPDGGPLAPMSFAQQRLWFVDQLEPGNPAYNCPVAMRLRGPLDVEALVGSLRQVVARHEALRTTYELVDGQPLQRIHERAELDLAIERRPGLPPEERQAVVDQLIVSDNEQPFDLRRGPVIRCRVVEFDAADHVLLVDVHHIANDAWSMRVLFDELAALYPARAGGRPAQLPPLAVQYADFAVWQRQRLSGRHLDEQLAHWRARLDGLVPLDLPTDHPRPTVLSHRGETAYLTLDPQLTRRLRAVGQEQGATLFMTLLAGFVALMSRYSRQKDVAIGTSTTGRDRPELDALIGFFVNTLVLRTSLDDDPTFRQLVGRVREVAMDAYAHSELPFDVLVRELNPDRDPSRTALVPVWFILDDTPSQCPPLGDVDVEIVVPAFTTTKFDLLVNARPTPEGGIVAQVQFSTDLYERGTVERMLRHYEVLLRGVAVDPDRRVALAPLLADEEAQRILVDWNATDEPFPSDRCLHELVLEQAGREPERPAVLAGGETLSYRHLCAGARRVAASLLQHGAGPSTRVAVCIERSSALPIGLLGTLCAGAAYVPLDAAYPPERLKFMLEDAGAVAVLVGATPPANLPATGLPVVSVVNALAGGGEDGAQPPVEVDPEELAYAIYTSGSTGTPKAIAVRHRGIVNNLTDLNRRFEVGPDDRLLALSSTSFDMSVYEVFGSLLAGASVVMPLGEDARDPQRWIELVRTHGVTLWNTAPPLLQLLVEQCERTGTTLPSLRLALCGGDWLPVDLPDRFRKVAPGARIVNLGGATEASIHSTVYPVDEVDPSWSSIPYGRPMANQRVYVLDDALQPVPVGVAGELHLAGTGLARGYLGRPALTEEKFVEAVLAGRPERLYRTGDLARWRGDGVLELLGRRDLLVKVHGLRVEIGEVEAALRRHPQVDEAVVVARDDQRRGRQLVAYVVAQDRAEVDHQALREHLTSSLPAYMVPARFVTTAELPTGLTNKVDRRRLAQAPLPSDDRSSAGPVPGAGGAVERVAAAFADVLGLDAVGPDDDFFELGGDSFLAIRAVRAIDGALPVVELFLHTTPRQLAARLDGAGGGERAMLHRFGGAQARLALVCIPYGGGSAAAYRPLATELDGDVAVWAAELPGHELTAEPQPLASTAETARRLADEIAERVDGPLAVYAQCAGVVVGVELTRLLEQRGLDVRRLYLGAALPDPDPQASLARERHTSDGDIDAFLTSLGGFDGALDPAHRAEILRLVRHDLTAASRFFAAGAPAERLGTPVRCVVGDADEATTGYEERFREWERYAHSVALDVVPGGGHYFVRDRAADLARLIAADADDLVPPAAEPDRATPTRKEPHAARA